MLSRRLQLGISFGGMQGAYVMGTNAATPTSSLAAISHWQGRSSLYNCILYHISIGKAVAVLLGLSKKVWKNSILIENTKV